MYVDSMSSLKYFRGYLASVVLDQCLVKLALLGDFHPPEPIERADTIRSSEPVFLSNRDRGKSLQTPDTRRRSSPNNFQLARL
jgi:hypothetical protein